MIPARRVAAGLAASAVVLLVWVVPADDSRAGRTSPDITERSGFALPCEEDELAAPVHNPDPSHGLTWQCVHVEDIATVHAGPTSEPVVFAP